MTGIRYVGGALAVAALVLLALGQQSPAHAGFTKLVDHDPNGCQNNTGVYSTITAALDDQQDGDVIYVCPGTYVEPTLLLTENNLTLTGPESGGAIIQMAMPTNDGRAIFVNTGHALVTHLEIDATAPVGYLGQTTALRNGGDSNTFSHLTITNADYGIDIQGSEPRLNEVTENNVTARVQAIACQCSESEVTNNTVQSPDGDEITGIFVTGNTFEVSGNTLTRAQLGVNGINGTITDNHVIGNGATDYDLVGLYNGPHMFADNTIENAGRNAIGIYSVFFDTNVTIVRNKIRDARIGILTFTQNNQHVIAVVGGSLANANTFVDSGGALNDANYLFQQGDAVTDTVDATFNDWGLCRAEDIEQEILHDPDNAALGTVLFSPFVAGESCATPTPTPSPTASPTPTPTASPTVTPTTVPTATPTASATPTDTPSDTPSSTPTPTPTGGAELRWGDSDCDGGISSRDNQALLRNVLQQNPLSQTEPCPDLGATVDGRLWGDWDCDGAISSRDNQALLRAVLQQNPLSQTEPCPDIGQAA